jgi:C4-dicarboxylate transporter DctM subunit
MEIGIVLLVFFVLLFLGLPIAYDLICASFLYIIFFSKIPIIIVAQQMLQGVDSFTLLAVPFFVIAGVLMQEGGISDKIVDFAKKLVGHLPGGMAIVTTLSSMIFAAMTGAGAATTAAVGGIMIPEMKKEGYGDGFACALQAVGGVFGPIIPPSILMVLYAVASGASVGDMLMAGVIPGIVLGAILIAVEVIICIRKGYKGSSKKASGKEIADSFIKSIWAMFAPLLILGGIYSGIFTPTEASAVCCFYCLIIGAFVYKGFKLK